MREKEGGSVDLRNSERDPPLNENHVAVIPFFFFFFSFFFCRTFPLRLLLSAGPSAALQSVQAFLKSRFLRKA